MLLPAHQGQNGNIKLFASPDTGERDSLEVPGMRCSRRTIFADLDLTCSDPRSTVQIHGVKCQED